MITLHESDITSFPHDNGIGVLRDAIQAYAEEELNGLFEFYMEYDSEGHLVDELKEERIIKAKAQDKLGYQLFRIYSITKNHENDNLIVQAQHITYDLADNFVESLVANNLTKKQVMELIGSSTVLPHPFNVTSSNTTTRSSTKLYRTNPFQMIGGMDGSVLQIWGGQIERDNFHLILHDRRGSDDGVKVTYEKNITGLTAELDIGNLVTRIFPFVYIEATNNEPARLITVNGKYIDSPHINDYEKIYIKPIDYSHDERINLDGTDTQIRQQLTNIANSYFTETGNDKIKVDMEVQFEHLWETEEYKDLAVLELVGMGDTVTIEHSRLKVNATAIVNYIRYDCIAEKNEEVRLGSVKARLTDNVNRVVDVAEKVEQAQQTANQAIRAANGKNTIYYGPDEPEGGIEGDLWFRVVDGEYTRTYRHDGIQWQLVLSVDVRDAIDEAQQAKDEAQQAVDRANQATQQATDAINQAQTAFDEAQAALSTASNAYDIATILQGDVTNLSTLVDEHAGQISSITQSVGSLTTRIGDAEGNITALQQTSSSLAARLTDAEGNITTLTTTVSGLQTTVSNIEGEVSSVTQLANALQVRMTNAEGDISTLTQTASSLQSTVSSLQTELDELEIGGRNLLRNSDFRREILSSYGTTDNWGKHYGDSFVDTNEGIVTIYADSEISQMVFEESGNYVLSVLARGAEISVRSSGNDISFSQPLTDEFQWYVIPFSITLSLSQSRLILGARNGDIEISKVQLEKGTIATDWSPAPEDMATQSQITQLSDAINLRVQKGDVINQINISDENILIDGRKVHITGQTTIDNGVIKSAHIESLDAGKITTGTLDAGKVTLINLVGLDIYGSRFRSETGTDFMEITGGNIRLQQANGRFVEINPSGFYGYNSANDVRFQADSNYVTSAKFGTSNLNVYLGASLGGEIRTVVYETSFGKGGDAREYDYVDIRTLGIKAAPNQHVYLMTDHEIRATSYDKSTYRDIRGNVIYGAGFRTTTTSLWMGTDSAMHIVNKGFVEGSSGNPIYRDLYTRSIWASGLATRSTHAYIGADGELRVVNKGYVDNLDGEIIYRDVRASVYRGIAIDLDGTTSATHFYVRPSANGEVRFTSRGTTDSYRPVRASSFNESSSRDYKTNIEEYTDSALEIIQSLTVVSYNLKDDLANGIIDKKVGFISEDSKAIATADGKAIQTYQLSAYNTKAIQELDMKFTNLEDKVNWLEIENQYLRQKIEHLEGMIA